METLQPFVAPPAADLQPRLPGSCGQTFQTRQLHDAPNFIRTFGTVVQTGEGRLRFRMDQAVEHAHPDPPPACARGKVAAFSRHEGWCEAVCYQVSEFRTQAQVVACANATAAVATGYVRMTGGIDVSMRLELPGAKAALVRARVSNDAWTASQTVGQTWQGLTFAVLDEARVNGRMCTVCSSPLNNYCIIQVERDDVLTFPEEEAIRAWRHFGLEREPLLTRIAVLGCGGEALPSIKFFTCEEREHPSAPLTGLALLGIAARQRGWPVLAAAHWVKTPSGLMAMPRVRISADGAVRVEFPKVIVNLDPTGSL